MMNVNYDAFENILNSLVHAAALLNLEENDYKTMKYPESELKVSILIVMDDGRVEVFEGYRV